MHAFPSLAVRQIREHGSGGIKTPSMRMVATRPLCVVVSALFSSQNSSSTPYPLDTRIEEKMNGSTVSLQDSLKSTPSADLPLKVMFLADAHVVQLTNVRRSYNLLPPVQSLVCENSCWTTTKLQLPRVISYTIL